MSVKRIAILTLLCSLSFLITFFITRRQAPIPLARKAALAANAPDSLQLAAMGLPPGRQLIAFVIGSSRYASCRRQETRAAFAALRRTLHDRYGREFREIKVVGVSLNGDIADGLAYLNSIGLNSFDEISVGSGWQNEQLARLVWREKTAEAAVPQIVVLSRNMTGKLDPVVLTYDGDSVLTTIAGYEPLVEWVGNGANLYDPPTPPKPTALAPSATTHQSVESTTTYTGGQR